MVTIQSRNGRKKRFTQINNFGQVPNNTAVLFSASFGEQMLYFLSAHFNKVFRTRTTRGFETRLFDDFVSKVGTVDIVIQTIAEGILHRRDLLWNPKELR